MGKQKKLRVVIHYDEAGEISVYSDDGTDIYWVDERVPNDRIYQMGNYAIPDGLLVGDIGHMDDESPASIRANAAISRIEGRSHLSVIDNDK